VRHVIGVLILCSMIGIVGLAITDRTTLGSRGKRPVLAQAEAILVVEKAWFQAGQKTRQKVRLHILV